MMQYVNGKHGKQSVVFRILLVVLLMLLSSIEIAETGSFRVFGPRAKRGTGDPVPIHDSFTVLNATGPYSLVIYNGGLVDSEVGEQRRLPSAAAAVENMRKSAGDTRELMSRLNEAERERAWVEIAEEFKQYEGPNGFEIPGEVLIGVGTK